MHVLQRILVPATGFLLAQVYSPALLAQTPGASEAPVTARTLALGGGTHAIASSTSGIFSNPGAMGLARVYHADGSFLYNPSRHRWALGSAIADSTRTIGAGLAYTYSSVADGADDRSGHDLRLALSAAVAEGVSLGVTARYMDHGGARSANGRLGTAFTGFTLDAGIAVRPLRFLSLGVTGYALTNPDTSVSPMSVGGGVGITPSENLAFVADAIWDLRSYDKPRGRFSAGAEFFMGHVPLRVGFLHDDGRQVQTLTAGLGYIDQSFAVEAALRQEVHGGDDTTLLLALRYFYRPM